MLLTGNKILIQLDPHPEHTITDSGVVVPHYTLVESDGGKMNTKASNIRYLAQGTVTNISPLASKRMEEEGTPLKVGDKVFVPDMAVSPNYQFFISKSSIVLNFDGHIDVPHTLIEAII